MDSDFMAMTGASAPPLIIEADSRARLTRLLQLCAARGASDLHLSPGLPPHIRVDGELSPLVDAPVSDDAAVQKMRRAFRSF